MTQRWTFSLDDDLATDFDETVDLGHGDNRSKHLRQAVREFVERRRDGESVPEPEPEPEPDPTPEPEPAPDPEPEPAPDPPAWRDELTDAQLDAIGEIVDTVADTWTDSSKRIERRKDAARAALGVCVLEGNLGKDDALNNYGLYDAYAVDGQNERTWWRKNIRPVLQEAGEYSQGAHGYVVDLEG